MGMLLTNIFNHDKTKLHIGEEDMLDKLKPEFDKENDPRSDASVDTPVEIVPPGYIELEDGTIVKDYKTDVRVFGR